MDVGSVIEVWETEVECERSEEDIIMEEFEGDTSEDDVRISSPRPSRIAQAGTIIIIESNILYTDIHCRYMGYAGHRSKQVCFTQDVHTQSLWYPCKLASHL